MKLSATQKTALAYYAALADKSPRPQNYNHGTRTVESLLSRGLLAVVGFRYGPLYGLTDAGRAALAQ